MNLADRVAVIYKGVTLKILPSHQATRRSLGLLMAGITENAPGAERLKPSPRILYIALFSLAAAVAAIGIAAIVLAILGANVFDTFKVILTEPLKDIFGITEILVRAIPSSWWGSALRFHSDRAF